MTSASVLVALRRIWPRRMRARLAVMYAILFLLAGAALLPSIALALGVWSGTSKAFEGILTAMWYIGPMNRVSGIDYTGSSNGPQTMHYVVVYFVIAVALFVAAAAIRARQIRVN